MKLQTGNLKFDISVENIDKSMFYIQSTMFVNEAAWKKKVNKATEK